MQQCGQAEAALDTAGGVRSVTSLLWSVVKEQLPPAEQREVAHAVGEQAIEDNQALFDEAAVLAELVDGLAASNRQLLQRLRLCGNPKRQLLQEKIQRLLSKLNIGDAGAQSSVPGVLGVQDKSVIKDKSVINFVRTASIQSNSSRPSSAGMPAWASRPSTAASSSSSSRSSYGLPPEAPEATLQALDQPVRAHTVDRVRERLQQALLLEKEGLLADIEVLQGLLEQEVDVQGTAQTAPPSLDDLQACSERLQQACAIQEQQHLQQFERALCGASAGRLDAGAQVLNALDQPSTSASSADTDAHMKQSSRPGKLRSMVQAARGDEGSGSRRLGASTRRGSDPAGGTASSSSSSGRSSQSTSNRRGINAGSATAPMLQPAPPAGDLSSSRAGVAARPPRSQAGKLQQHTAPASDVTEASAVPKQESGRAAMSTAAMQACGVNRATGAKSQVRSGHGSNANCSSGSTASTCNKQQAGSVHKQLAGMHQ